MPIYEYLCLDCGNTVELIFVGESNRIECKYCGSSKLKKLISAHSSVSGPTKNSIPGPGDTACCGSNPSTAGCSGPGSCCGKS